MQVANITQKTAALAILAVILSLVMIRRDLDLMSEVTFALVAAQAVGS